MTMTLAHPPTRQIAVSRPPRAIRARIRVRIVTIPDRSCIAIEGWARPTAPSSEAAMGALYASAYSLHFLLRDRGIEARIGPPEAPLGRRSRRR